jgi:hypothetical protein
MKEVRPVVQDNQVRYVGIDAHQETLSIAVLVGDAAQPLPVQTIANRAAPIRRCFKKLLEQGSVIATYEAGSLGRRSRTEGLQTDEASCGSQPANISLTHRRREPHGPPISPELEKTTRPGTGS